MSKVETGQQRPSDAFAAGANEVLRTGGALKRSFYELEQWWRRTGPVATKGTSPSPAEPQPAGLVVEHDEAELRYDGSTYRPFQRRKLRNVGDSPVTQYLVRISVDSHPRATPSDQTCSTGNAPSRRTSSSSERSTTASTR